jgi:hypothetical protein
MEVEMKFLSGLLISLATAALAYPARATTPDVGYIVSGTCLNSTSGFNAKLEPVDPGTGWTESFNNLGSGTVSGNTVTVTEEGQSVFSAVFGFSPPKHVPQVNAYTNSHTDTFSGPNADGSFTDTFGTTSGTFTSGPHAGLTFTASAGIQLKNWQGRNNGVFVMATTGAPVIQTVSLSNNTRYKRICTISLVTTAPLQ